MFGKNLELPTLMQLKTILMSMLLKKRWLDGNSSIELDMLVTRLSFSKLGVHIDENGHLNWHIFLCQSLQNLHLICLKMLYKAILLTITTISSTIKLIYVANLVLIVALGIC